MSVSQFFGDERFEASCDQESPDLVFRADFFECVSFGLEMVELHFIDPVPSFIFAFDQVLSLDGGARLAFVLFRKIL